MDDSSVVRKGKRYASARGRRQPPSEPASTPGTPPPNVVHLDTLSQALRQHLAPPPRRLTNMQARTLVVLLVGPLLVALLASSKEASTLVAIAAVFIGGVEWSGLKRHLKVSLLAGHGGGEPGVSPALVGGLSPSPSIPGTSVPLRPVEYPVPFVPDNPYTTAKHLAWAGLCVAAYAGEAPYIVCLSVYFLVMVVVTLTAHNRLEQTVQRAVERLRAAGRDRPPADCAEEASWAAAQEALVRAAEAGARDDVDAVAERVKFDAFVRRAQQAHFVQLELAMVAERQPTEQLLDFCLDIFGLMWISELCHPFFLYQIPAVGRPWFFACIVGNFVNDINALLVGRGLRALRQRYEAEAPSEDAWRRFVRSTPRPLYPAISPNKSLEGALAGVLTNGMFFAVALRFFFNNRFFHAPPVHVIAPCFQSFPFYFVVGLSLGVIGVLGDLLQSLLKRVARVKDAGNFIPGHGGLLDRADGLLLSFRPPT
ncbi:phosphatidate cytidylyltransferase-like protein [Strigomonas culicis]|uniref:Phosphatidate cytidylyltransferase-like protein n=1 Tax=Strigomonas culicis TaxID=28005 RepID=S9UKF6_9TRYP|nr:phosphatidate cytidylyltransferase-like protein [Strigomonas culicis]|eukprot:EPY31327.1 phosphatidate cytidylyltransferase-like protein [Strigomonas culicis]